MVQEAWIIKILSVHVGDLVVTSVGSEIKVVQPKDSIKFKKWVKLFEQNTRGVTKTKNTQSYYTSTLNAFFEAFLIISTTWSML